MSSAAYPEHCRPDRADSVAEAAREGYTAPRSPLQADDGRSIGLVLADITANISTLLQQEGPMRVTDVAARLGVSVSTAHRLLDFCSECGPDRRPSL